jgi:hypothetical protein
MYADGQNLVSGQTIKVFPPNSNIASAFTLSGNVPSGQNQRTILIADSAFAGPTADFTTPGLSTTLSNLASGGALCYSTVDCVSWGSFVGNAFIPSPAGTPIAGPLPTMQVLARPITRGCATALDPADDTNNSSADFGFVVGFPTRNNSMAPTETLCSVPTAKKKCKKKKAKSKSGAYAAKKKCKKKKKKK